MTHTSEPDPGRIYRILAQCYLEPPNRSTVEDVSDWAASWLESGPSSLSTGIEGPLGTLSELDTDGLDSIKTDFTRLFRAAPNTNVPDPPYESLYVDGSIFGEPTTAVRNAYREAGFTVETETEREAADHIGIELEFLGELRSREAAGDETARELQREFLDSHLGRWIEEFETAVMAADPEPYYGALLELTTALVAAERQRLENDRTASDSD